MDTSIYNNIKALPPLDDTVLKIQRVCQNKNSNLNELSQIIKQDPMLMANILKSANSPLYGFSREINDINRAVTLFGMATIRGFALYGSMKKNFVIDLKPYNISTDIFSNVSIARSSLALNWTLEKEIKELLIVASFMMEVGRIVASKEIISRGMSDKFLQEVAQVSNIEELSKLEKSMIGMSCEEITSKIFEHWNFESNLVESIFYSSDPDIAPDYIKQYAAYLKVIATTVNIFGICTDKNIELAQKYIQDYDLNESNFGDVVLKIRG